MATNEMQNEMQMVLDHIMERALLMKEGEVTDCKGLIDRWVWDETPTPERRYVFGKPVSWLVDQGLVPLEFIGFNSKRHNLYRKK